MAEEYDQQASSNKRKWPSLDNESLSSQENKKNNPASSSSLSIGKVLWEELGKSIAPIEDEATNDDGVIKVDPKPNIGEVSKTIDYVTGLMVKLQYDTNETPYYLSGNFGPIRKETPPTGDLKVIQGQIPKLLSGMMIRNGPNPPFDPIANYACMLHAIRFKDGKAIYVSRYVQTSRFLQEQVFRSAEFFKYGDLLGSFGLFTYYLHLLKDERDVLDMSYGFSNANTGLIHHNGMLMALVDFDKPYVIKVLDNGDLETLGINGYKKKLTHNFTPHPKRDPETGELFIFGSSYTAPYAIYNVVRKDGIMSDPVPITTSGPSYMHDFGITEKYVIFMDLPYNFDPENMATNNDWIYRLDTTKKSRFGILPRYAKTEEGIKWFEFDESFFIFHNANAWEDGDGNIVLISSVMKNDDKHSTFVPPIFYGGPKPSLKGVEFTLPQLFKLTFNMKTGKCNKVQLSTTYSDYPKVNESYIGRKLRYVYTSKFDQLAKIPSIVKLDLGIAGAKPQEIQFDFLGNKYGSEVVFVPSVQTDRPLEEDDGYLITFVHDEDTSISYTYIISAQKMEIEAVIELPSRVPYGFHAIYMTEMELQAQISNLA
ncbi:oxygenase [Lithospermum erythrorhizon]|uniref:carotenoid 9,10-dioxygenase n=1 Tax=Lithospermum erythrorhizon TaxID=34254 RepID=A0AAV3PMR7_LITER